MVGANSDDISQRLILLCLLFGAIGAVQSVDFPCFVGTVGAWTRRSSRGTITGIWATCGNVGNIFGLQLASVVLGNHEGEWQRLMYITTVIYLSLALCIFIFYVAEPREVGIDMTDDHLRANQPE